MAHSERIRRVFTRPRLSHFLLAFLTASQFGQAAAAAQATGTLIVRVSSPIGTVAQAEIRVADVLSLTNESGEATVVVPAGTVEVVVSRFGFETARQQITVAPGSVIRLNIELTQEPVLTEEVVVTATRTSRRIDDLPMRVEVVPQEEIDEKLFMTPGDVSMMLTETNGIRVQATSPSQGATSVRVQGLRGRYTQMLADGLPLYGQGGSISVLQVPPMDLGQVEIIKGVASALYGASALGGVVNLVSRRPVAGQPEREVLVNRTSRDGTDAVLWLSEKPRAHWGYTLLGGGHWQERTDVNHDGWTDLPGYRRAMVRPRVLWEDGAGRSLFVTAGALTEDRVGGTLPGLSSPDGTPFPEDVNTRRVDGGLVGRFVTGDASVVTIRSAGVGQWQHHRFGENEEHDVHHTWFAEASVNGTTTQHNWVIGAAVQRDAYRSDELPSFDYTYTVPGVFAQDDYALAQWLTVSASGRLDRHNTYGTFFSPRLSALVKLGGGWTLRPSAGLGFFAPTPFTEETEATGLSRLAPLGQLEAERGRSLSVDLGWKRGPLEMTTTWFQGEIKDPVVLRDTTSSVQSQPVEIVNAAGPARTHGSEFIARFHRDEMDVIASHMFVWATEADPDTGVRGESSLTPRHTAGVDWLWNLEGHGRVGVELFYTGRQRLRDSPYRERSEPYVLWGVIGEWRIGRARVFLNAENLGNVRQSDFDPLVLPSRRPDGRWTDDIWGPVDGRTLNGGVRLRF